MEAGVAGEEEAERREGQFVTSKNKKKQSLFGLFKMYKEEGLCPPKHMVFMYS